MNFTGKTPRRAVRPTGRMPYGHGNWRLRAIVPMLVGALAVHRLEYFAAGFAGFGHPPAAEHAHGYFGWLLPLAGFALMIAALELVTWARHRRDDPAAAPATRSWQRLWMVLTTCLVGIYIGQEVIEGVIVTGQPLELLGVGSWVVLPVALAIGAILALGMRGAVALQRILRPRVQHARATARRPRAVAVLEARAGELARFLAGRGPPATSAL